MNSPIPQSSPDSAREVAVAPEGAGLIAPPLEKRRLQLYTTQVGVDVAMILLAHCLASVVYYGHAFDARTMLAGQVLLPLFLMIALYNSTYSLGSLTDWRSSTMRMLLSLVMSAGLLNFLAFYTKSSANFSRATFTIAFGMSAFLMVMARQIQTYWVNRRFGPSLVNVLVIDDGGPPLTLPHAIHIKAAEHGLSPALFDPHALDRLSGYLRNMDRVIVSCLPEKRAPWAMVLKGSGVSGEVISDFVRSIGALGVRHYDDAELSSLVVSTGPLGIRARAAKRLFDVVFSASCLLLLSPLLLAVALMIKLGDGGPVLFRQRRLGRGNSFFTVLKFRTMKVEDADADGNKSTARDDDRITWIGRYLRASSIDELPQLINVLVGEMSMVGPRPHAIGSQAGDKLFWEVDLRYWQRHSLKPGVTGLAQIRGLRGATHEEEDLALRLRSDLEYLDGWSLWRDMGIILLTLRVLTHHKAY